MPLEFHKLPCLIGWRSVSNSLVNSNQRRTRSDFFAVTRLLHAIVQSACRFDFIKELNVSSELVRDLVANQDLVRGFAKEREREREEEGGRERANKRNELGHYSGPNYFASRHLIFVCKSPEFTA